MIEASRKSISNKIKALWKTTAYRNNMLKKFKERSKSQEWRDKISKTLKEKPRKGLTIYIKNCPECKNDFEVTSKHRNSKIYCSKQCVFNARSKRISGKNNFWYGSKRVLNNNPNWRNGISFDPYPLGWNRTFKEQIRYRDDYKCQICGIPEIENGRRLDVHHIDYNKNNISLGNLVSLCKSCHMKTGFNRWYWQQILLTIMSVKEKK